MRTSFLTTDWLPGVAMLKIAVALAVVLTALAARLHAQDSTLWRYTAEGEISFYRISPLGHLIVSEKNKLVALDPKSGEPAWTREDIQGLAREDFKIIPFMPLALVLSENGMRWIDLASGTNWWSSTAPPLVAVQWYVMVPQQRMLLLFGVTLESLSSLVAVDIVTGGVKWRHDNLLSFSSRFHSIGRQSVEELFGPGHQPPVVDSDTTLILYVSKDGPIKLHSGSGRLLWRTDFLKGKDPPMLSAGYAQMLYYNGMLFVPHEKTLLAVRANDGVIVWDRREEFRSRIAQMELTRHGLLVRGHLFLNLLHPETGTSIWKKPFRDLNNDTPFVVRGDAIYITKKSELIAIDFEDGSSRQLAKFKFKGSEKPEILEEMGQDFLLSASQNFLLLDDSGAVKYQRYYRAPAYSFLEALVAGALEVAFTATLGNLVEYSLGFVATNVAYNVVGPVGSLKMAAITGQSPSFSFRFFDFGDVDRMFEDICRQRRQPRVGAFCAGELMEAGGQIFVEVLKTRYKATVDAVNYAYVYTSKPLGKREGYSLVMLDKTNGEEVARVWTGHREPAFVLDPISRMLFVKESATEISAHQFPLLTEATGVDRDTEPDPPVSGDSLRIIAETHVDDERPRQRAVAVTSSFDVGVQLHGSGVWVAQEQGEAYIAVPIHLVHSDADGATTGGVELRFADGETHTAIVVDSMDEAMGLALLLVDDVELQQMPSNDGDPRALAIGAVTYLMDSIDGADGELVEAGTVSSRDGLFIEVSISGSSQPAPRIPRGGNLRFNAAAGLATAVDPHDPAKVYAGSQAVHQSADGGQTWVEISPDLTLGRGAILTIAPSPAEPRVIWVGSDDGTMQLTRRGGRTWTRVTPHTHAGGQVVHIEASPVDAGAAVAFFRNGDENGSLRLIATQDYGRTWEDVAASHAPWAGGRSSGVGGGLFDSDRQLIGLVISRNERKITALRIDVVLQWLRSRGYSPSSRN